VLFELPQPPLIEFLSLDPPVSSPDGGAVPPSMQANKRFFRSNLLSTALEFDGDVNIEADAPLGFTLFSIPKPPPSDDEVL
jgi:hypothetical protein